ncbi:MAG: ABC transporter ATP-binding protein [Ruminococcaceae bacterium]|nr:ABC transporter ATP-binding protein [Oscillospiraceae bacterium]
MLKLQNVTKTFGDFKALDDLSLSVPKGSVYGLVGPNGAGKSTAIRILTGVYRPDNGQVLMEGQPIWENDALKARIGLISDEIFYFPSSTLEDMYRFYSGIFPNYDRELYARLSDVFRLPSKKQIRSYSKGMQKQAAFQLVLCAHPDVLILDEPVDGLDPVMRRTVSSLILSEVAQRQVTVLISSHNLRELEDLCDHVGIMDRGKMLLERSLADMQGTTHKVQMVGQVPDQLEILHTSGTGRLQNLIVRGTAAEVERILAEANPEYFELIPMSLEEIFIYELGGIRDEIKNIIL